MRRRLYILVVMAVIASMVVPPAVAAPARQGPGPTVKTAADAARAKIHPNLLADIDAALGANAGQSALRIQSAQPTEGIQFVARIKAGTDLSAYTNKWFTRPFIDPLGNTVASGFARPDKLLKMAALSSVLYLQRPESLVEPPTPTDPDVELALNADIAPAINLDPNASPGPAPEGWYHTGSAIHGSQEAWKKGYTGVGVRYMSNDSGADYCHPDLFGTWAYIDHNVASPYYGLPEMFDSYSLYYAALDRVFGIPYIASGLTDYADTSTEVSGLTASFRPIQATAAHTYTLPGTSKSGIYHIGSHPDKALAQRAATLSSLPGGSGTAVVNERAGVLVVDANTAGVYDTVYVDLNYNFNFNDDVPARLSRDFKYREAACFDRNADGLNDVSGGLVYFISDGTTAVPTMDWFYGIPGVAFGNGDLVAFHVMDYTESGGNHGMGTTSVATGQGVVAGSINFGPSGPPQAEGKGLVVGPGKDVASTQNGNFYTTPFIEDAYIFAGLGYDSIPGTGDDIQIVSNSWSFSTVDNDGLDLFSRQIDSINRAFAPNTALLFSTGNGAPGYGTETSASPASGIGVGASTLYDTIGTFEPIASADQIVGGDPMSWSNRGPGVRNVSGVDIVATGAFGTGDLPLNSVLNGAIATESFGGTSMAASVAAGNLALIYQAWRQRTGSWPTFADAQALIMGSAKNTDHDVWSQGAGLVDADRGTDIAAGLGSTYATPAEWSVGDYRGTQYKAFAHVINRGESDTQTFTLWNYSDHDLTVRLTTNRFRLIGTHDYSFTSLDQSLDHGLNATPDYAFRIDPDIPRRTDLLMVRVTKSYEQFDPDDDLSEPYNNWRVYLQNWTDLDHDGEFWVDANHNDKVDAAGEWETGETIRFTYGHSTGPTQQARISNPLERMADGVLLTFSHRDRLASAPTTDLKVEASFWKRARWSWIRLSDRRLTIPAHSSATFEATLTVPQHAAYGMYEGSILVSHDGHEISIPVTAAVAAQGTEFEFGQRVPHGWMDASWDLGVRLLERPLGLNLYENSWMFGYTDYDGRAESGDWRFFWTDIDEDDLPESTTASPYLVADNTWASAGTDIDTILLGPTDDDFSPSPLYGPYTLETIGASPNTYIGSGRWRFQTSSGGSREIVAAPAAEGLHAILFHQVKVDGSVLNEPFGGKVGLVTVDPGTASASGAAGAGSVDVTISSELDLRDFVAEGFGLGAPVTTQGTVLQDDPNNPATASFTTTVTINHGALLEVSTGGAPGNDIDVYVYGPGGQRLGSSTTPTDQEFVSILFPADGVYTIAVHGWSVPGGSATFNLTVNAVQGFDLTVDDLPSRIRPGETATITVNWDTTGKAPGIYSGLILMGPAAAPGLLQAPVKITVTGP